MSTQVNKDKSNDSDTLKIASIGIWLPKLAMDIQIPKSDGPEVAVGRNKLPLKSSNVFAAGCTEDNVISTDNATFMHCGPKEVHIRNLESWQKTLDSAADMVMRHQGSTGRFTCRLAELGVYGNGSGGQLDLFMVPSCRGILATIIVIVDPESDYLGGKINAYRLHSKDSIDSVSFDFRNRSSITLLFCFPEATVRMEPVRKGFRAHLMYGVYMDTK